MPYDLNHAGIFREIVPGVLSDRFNAMQFTQPAQMTRMGSFVADRMDNDGSHGVLAHKFKTGGVGLV